MQELRASVALHLFDAGFLTHAETKFRPDAGAPYVCSYTAKLQYLRGLQGECACRMLPFVKSYFAEPAISGVIYREAIENTLLLSSCVGLCLGESR